MFCGGARVRLLVVLGLLLIWSPVLFSQSAETLKITETLHFHFPGRLGTFIAKCDAQGNVYFADFTGATGEFTSVTRLTREASASAKFVYTDRHGEVVSSSFAVDSKNKRVYFTGEAPPDVSGLFKPESRQTTEQPEDDFSRQWFLTTFLEDGTVAESAHLSVPLAVSRMTVLPSGDLMMAGMLNLPSKIPRNYLGVFQPNGSLVREIPLPEPLSGFENSISDAYPLLPMSSDGYVYLLRLASQGPIFVISPEGRVVQTIHFTPPADSRILLLQAAGQDVVVVSGRVMNESAPGRVSAHTEGVTFTLLDRITGEVRHSYSAGTTGLGAGNYVCSDGNQFTFVRKDGENNFSLFHAEAH